MQSASSILHGQARDTAGLRLVAIRARLRLFPVCCLLSQYSPALCCPRLNTTSWGEEAPRPGCASLIGRERSIFLYLLTSEFGNRVNTKSPDLPKGQSNRKKIKAPFPKLPALCFHFRIIGEGCKLFFFNVSPQCSLLN